MYLCQSQNNKSPFYTSTEDSIVLFCIRVSDSENISTLSLIVHRSALLSAAWLSSDSVAIPWEECGPQVCRWIDSDDTSGFWITTTCGHRYVMIEDTAPTYPSLISILDFNPYSIRRLELNGDLLTFRKKIVKEDHPINPIFAFQNPLWSNLPYIETFSGELFDYDGILVDGQRIIGARVSKCCSAVG